MPSWPATRRASSAASSEQQLFWNSLYESATSCRRSQTPTVSTPDSASSAAATDESTPPDMATRTRSRPAREAGLNADLLAERVRGDPGAAVAQLGDGLRDDLDRLVDLRVGGRPAERQAQRAAGLLLGIAKRGQDVRRLGRAGRARRAGRGREAGQVERADQRLALRVAQR